MATPVNSSGVAPLLVTVAASGSLVSSTTWLPKSSENGFSATSGMMPVPVSTKLSGLPSASLVTATPCDWLPVMPGANSWASVQPVPGASMKGASGQVPSVVRKNGGSTGCTASTLRSTLPTLSMVVSRGPAVSPTSTSPKSVTAGVTAICGASVISMVVPACWSPSSVALTSSAMPVAEGVKVAPASPAVSAVAAGAASPSTPPSKSTDSPSGTTQLPLKIELPPSTVPISEASSALVLMIGIVVGSAVSAKISQLPASTEPSGAVSQPAAPGPSLQPHQLMVASDGRSMAVLLAMPTALPVMTLHLKSPAPLASMLTPVALLRMTKLLITGTGGRR